MHIKNVTDTHFELSSVDDEGNETTIRIRRDFAATLADELKSLATAPSRCLALDTSILG